MITLAGIAKKYKMSKTRVRKLYLQGRLTSGGKPISAVRTGNVLLFPDDTKVPKKRASYGSLTKRQRSI